MYPIIDYANEDEEDKRINTPLKYVVSYLEEDKKVIFKSVYPQPLFLT